jgi:TPP-dependent pyruvate/acetoin dehydrogenase alpha subunit
MDVLAVGQASSEAVARARRGEGPTMLVCDTYRFRGHFEGDEQKYRTTQELENWKVKDPIIKFKTRLIEMGVLTETEYEEIERRVTNELEDAVQFAISSDDPAPGDVLSDVYTSL